MKENKEFVPHPLLCQKKKETSFVPHPIFKKGKHKWATQLKPDPDYHFSGARYG